MHKYSIYEKHGSVLNINAEVSKVAVVHHWITGLYWSFFLFCVCCVQLGESQAGCVTC